ncbi:hypothetical protein KV201_05850 [Shewanella sp. SR1]|uniref:hypothetical protein n=1 Tax=Shewanella sp. SR1 TaxID=2855505 RepID=UPI001CF29D73|nr:hypothetical protein [Shewanella sp. SR1]MCB2381694.1 hypothetical protein [Shewanella sp. SR1]
MSRYFFAYWLMNALINMVQLLYSSDATWCSNRIILQQLIAISLLFNGYQLWPEKCSEYSGKL